MTTSRSLDEQRGMLTASLAMPLAGLIAWSVVGVGGPRCRQVRSMATLRDRRDRLPEYSSLDSPVRTSWIALDPRTPSDARFSYGRHGSARVRHCYPFLPEGLYLPSANGRILSGLMWCCRALDLDRVVSRNCADAPCCSHLVFVPSRSFCRRSSGDRRHLRHYDLRP